MNERLPQATNLLDRLPECLKCTNLAGMISVPKFGALKIVLLSAATARSFTVSCHHYTNKDCSEELLHFIHGSWFYGVSGDDA